MEKIKNKKILVTISLVVVVLLPIVFKDNIIVWRLKKVNTTLINNKIYGFYNNEECSYLNFGDRKVQDRCRDESIVGSNSKEFNEEDWKLFNQIKNLTKNKYRSIDVTYMENRVSQIKFIKNCGLCGTSYVYKPGYILPIDNPGETVYYAINKDWYRIQQDPL
jgi:hypothetical protein